MLSIIKGSMDHQEREGRGGETSISLPPPAGGGGDNGPNEIQILRPEGPSPKSEFTIRKSGSGGDNNWYTSKIIINTDNDKSSLLVPNHGTTISGTHSFSPAPGSPLSLPPSSPIELPGTPTTPTNGAAIAVANANAATIAASVAAASAAAAAGGGGGEPTINIHAIKAITSHVSISEQVPQLTTPPATAVTVNGPSPVPRVSNYISMPTMSSSNVNGTLLVLSSSSSSSAVAVTQPPSTNPSRAGTTPTPPVLVPVSNSNSYKYSIRPPQQAVVSGISIAATTGSGGSISIPTMSRDYVSMDTSSSPQRIIHTGGIGGIGGVGGDESMLLLGARTKAGEHGNAKLSDAEITLDVILAHPVTVEMLKDRLATLHAPETLIFYLEVQAYKVAPLIHLKRMASDIYDTYIHVGAENQVNFSSTLRELISKRVKESRPNHMIFKEAEREAHRLIMQNVWPSFRDSHEFKVSGMILRGLVAPPDRPRGMPIHWHLGGDHRGDGDQSQAKSKKDNFSHASNIIDQPDGKESNPEAR
jgi:hypothetical protein